MTPTPPGTKTSMTKKRNKPEAIEAQQPKNKKKNLREEAIAETEELKRKNKNKEMFPAEETEHPEENKMISFEEAIENPTLERKTTITNK